MTRSPSVRREAGSQTSGKLTARSSLTVSLLALQAREGEAGRVVLPPAQPGAAGQSHGDRWERKLRCRLQSEVGITPV